MRWIYVSPHLDDAVLSAGGLIYEQTRAGMDVEIWTMMCGFPPTDELSPYAQLMHYEWGIPAAADVINARREEDIKAAGIVGAKVVHFNFLDCIYRRNKNGDWLYSYVFDPPHEGDEGLPVQIADAISARLQPTDQLVCQFGIGSHVDHVLVRRGLEIIQSPILYDADIPYLFRNPDELAPQIAGMNAIAYRMTDAGLNSWLEASAAYESQINSLFDSPEAMQVQFQQYWSEYIGIRLWSAP
jgi:LmbE family N-acetylglucosaminyl deacetylase